MKESNKEIVELLQDRVNEQFDKRLNINIGDDEYNIAIRRDQIPKIKVVKMDRDGSIVIKLSENADDNFDDNLLRNSKGELQAIKIDNKFLRNYDNRSFLKKLISNNSALPENDKEEVLLKHRDKRFLHAISDFLLELRKLDITYLSRFL